MAYKKTVKGDSNQANEIGPFNRISVFNDGSGRYIIVFGCVIVTAAITYLAMAQTFLLTSIVVVCFLGGAGGGGFLWINHLRRDRSRTHAQLEEDRAHEDWCRRVYPVGAHIVIYDPVSREIAVHNARDISETRSYAVDAMPHLEPKGNAMPSLYDLGKGNGKEEAHG